MQSWWWTYCNISNKWDKNSTDEQFRPNWTGQQSNNGSFHVGPHPSFVIDGSFICFIFISHPRI